MESSSADGPASLPSLGRTSSEDHPGNGHDSAISICRICRGEGTADEPLFYPCKCSGSIKFVHQDCLMEWLSHSQKKYCELCKTPFRFTKLYAPDMPETLPIHVFLQHMAKYTFRHILVWLRAVLAISVWAVWLPYFMRAVWSFMFWISDEGLGTTSALIRPGNASTITQALPSSILDLGTCPASPLLAVPTTSVAEAKAIMNQMAVEDISEYLVRVLLGPFGPSGAFNNSDASFAADGSDPLEMDTTTRTNSTSLLSNVAFLNNICRSRTINRAIVSVIEGQLITILIIVSFILVILVRDYVVQQQPEINMRAAFAAPNNNVVIPEQANDQVELQDDIASNTSDDAPSDGETPDDASQPEEPNWPVRALEDSQEASLQLQDPKSPGHGLPDEDSPGTSSSVEPHLPTDMDEGTNGSPEERATVIDYLRIYRRADGNLHEILRIMEEEGLQEKLSYWVDVTRRSLRDQEQRKATQRFIRDTDILLGTIDDQQAASAASEQALSRPTSPADDSRGKGKDKALPSPPLEAETHLRRPRAASDGPQTQNSVNPLANHTWTFAALNDEISQLEPQALASKTIGSFSEDQGPSSGIDEDQATRVPEMLDGAQSPVHGNLQEQDTLGASGNEDGDANEWEDEAEDQDAGIVGRVANFMWGDLAEPQPTDDAVDDDGDLWRDLPIVMADNEEAVEDADEDGGEIEGDEVEDEEEVAGDGDGVAANAAFDAEAIEDMEDFEGVMELIGMRGPLGILFQNAIFCAVLVSATIFVCIFVPYNIGRVALWILASPMRLVRMLFELSRLTQDAAVLMGGLCSWTFLNIIDMVTKFIGGSLAAQVISARKMSWALWTNAGSRVLDYIFMDFPMTASEIQNFSAISHDALNTVKSNIGAVLASIDDTMISLCSDGLVGFSTGTVAMLTSISDASVNISSWLLNPSAWVISIGEADERLPISPELAQWSSLDRFWAILAGYISVCMLSALYLQRDGPFSRGTVMHAWEAGVIDTLQQASGILKVILIISIEMLVFPLYCGLLLDTALLPLFEGATFKSRMLFTYNYPMTSVFVHWFVGTGYMFHFALFVSMCRKIMRPGVLYFIRDPDDPEFHPVRDVLERNLTTQLRKILFSAFVYGALVIVCLGGVVWGLSFAMPDVLPVHYSSNEPVLEFPVDLLFYNFLMPLAVKFFKPSDTLHAMYTWWFRKCARFLRLTCFLFGERRIDEEGTLRLSLSSPHKNLLTGLLLEVDATNTVIPKTWQDTFEGGDAKPNPRTSKEERKAMRRRKHELVETGQLVPSGRFVRAPACDRVKIPPGQKVFLTVNERGKRQDGQADTDLYASRQFQAVYIPSNFRTRIFVFIMSLWGFAAVTGVGLTVVPLIFGRMVFKSLIPEHIRTNDIYAFSIGIFTLGSLAYSVLNLHSMISGFRRWIEVARHGMFHGSVAKRFLGACVIASKVAYTYFVMLIVFPLLASTIMELYLIIPLHTYLYPPTTLSTGADASVDRHTVRVVQSWTLGLLYLKLGSRLMASAFPDSRITNALRSSMRRGRLHPDVALLNRAFIFPGLAAAAVAILGPPALMTLIVNRLKLGGGGDSADEALKMMVLYRQSYPAAAFAAIFAKNAVAVFFALDHWTAGVRDEAYLIGERLHNFGAGAGARKARRMWGGGRQRL